MFRLLPLFLLLPLIEIIGFIVIGGRIGFAASLFWLIAATFIGKQTLRRKRHARWNQSANPDEIFINNGLFTDISLTIGAYLLIFPGFISDFLAIPFLLAPLRAIIFRHMNSHPENFVRRTTRQHWHPENKERGDEKTSTIIDGEFRRIDDE